MIELVHGLLDVVPVVERSSGDDAPVWLLLAGPLAGGGLYFGFYRYYRNTDKTHEYERDTLVDAQPVHGGEHKVDHVRKTRRSRIDDDNRDDFRRRVRRMR